MPSCSTSSCSPTWSGPTGSEFWGYPQSRAFADLLIDCEEDRTLRVLDGMLPATSTGEVGRLHRAPLLGLARLYSGRRAAADTRRAMNRNRKLASVALLVVGVVGIGWLEVAALLDDSSFLIASVGERPAWIACFTTVFAIGVVLALPPAGGRCPVAGRLTTGQARARASRLPPAASRQAPPESSCPPRSRSGARPMTSGDAGVSFEA